MSQEDRIQEALKALAAEDAGKQASAETEAGVLQEFRRLQSEKLSVKEAEAVSETQAVEASGQWYRPAFWALAGAAAMLAVVLGLQGWLANSGVGAPPEQVAIQSEVPDTEVASKDQTRNVDPPGSPQEQRERPVIPPPSAPAKRLAGRGTRAVPASLTNGPQALTNGPRALTNGPESLTNGSRAAEPLMPPSPGSDAPGASGAEEPLTPLPGGEVATDFFPLLEVIPPFERGRILRTTVPAATMREVGLWVHPDRLYDPVEADVLVGNDGIARAIRFVGRAPDGDSAVPPVDRQ